MEAVIAAMGILMWIWGTASLRLVQRVLPPAAGATRSAWLALATVIGGVGLVALALLVLPVSVLSQGWSRETLQSAQLWTQVVVVMTAMAGLLRGHRQLSPAVRASEGRMARAPGNTTPPKAKKRP